MKNKKLIVVFILVVAFLLGMVTCTKASDNVAPLPSIVTDPNGTQQGGSNTQGNNETGNSEAGNNAVTNLNVTGSTNNTSKGNNETLPQTGVQEDTTLFIFIGICIASAAYAYFRIRKYNGIR